MDPNPPSNRRRRLGHPACHYADKLSFSLKSCRGLQTILEELCFKLFLMMLLVIASSFIVNEIAAPVGPIIGSLAIFGELLASSSIMTPKLEIVVMSHCLS